MKKSKEYYVHELRFMSLCLKSMTNNIIYIKLLCDECQLVIIQIDFKLSN